MATLDAWQRRCAASAPLRFVDVNLRGAAQVMFQNHPLTGALFIAAIAWGVWSADAGAVLAGGLLGLVAATLCAMWLRVDAAGLCGYSGLLVGLALPTFLDPTPLLWAYVLLGGAVLAVLTAHLLGAESDLVSAGLLGFSPVLTAVALGMVFTVVAQAALNMALAPLDIPALTAPFVLCA